MDLSTLPLVVLDRVLLYLNLRSLRSICLTCKTLRFLANRLLYRNPRNICLALERQRAAQRHRIASGNGDVEYRLSDRMEKVEHSLSTHHANATFLRVHTSYKPRWLQAIWSLPPVSWTRLRLDGRWFSTSSETEIVDCLNSKHPKTIIEELSLAGPPNEDYSGVLRRLDSFRGLSTLHIQLASIKLTLHPDRVIQALNCPQLKRLVLWCSSHLVSLGDELPSLEALEIYPLQFEWRYGDDNGDEQFDGPNEQWKKLAALKERGIKFMYIPLFHKEIGLLAFVYQHAERERLDPTPLARWLITSRVWFQRSSARQISLRRLSPAHRESALRTIKKLNLDESLQFELRLHHHDSTFISHILPMTISSLNLVISQYNKVCPAVISEIIRSLPNIRTLTVHIYVGTREQGQLSRDATCFQSEFEFPVLAIKYKPHDLEFACQFQLNVVQGEVQTWRLASECDPDSGQPKYADAEISIPNLEREVAGWWQMNTSLEKIVILFDGETELFDHFE